MFGFSFKNDFSLRNVKREMDIFKEVRSQYEIDLKKEIEFQYEYEKLVTIHRRFQAKNILLDTLEAEFLRFGKDKFVEVAAICVDKDVGLCSPNYLFDSDEISDLEKEYSRELMAFNRQFLSKNLAKIESSKLIHFLTESLLINNISKEFLNELKSTNLDLKASFWNFLSVIKKSE